MRYLITISKQQDNRYQAVIKQTGQQAKILNDLRLHETDAITIKNQPIELGFIVSALQTYDEQWLQAWFDERGQLELGRHLYQQLFDKQAPENKAELFIISDDEHINHLPWILLAHQGLFLNLVGWSIVLSSEQSFDDIELFLSPRLLIVAPDPLADCPTRATEHLHNLEKLLTEADSTLKPVIVSTWQDFIQAVRTQPPEMLYYYGHGVSDEGFSTHLVFADENNQRLDIPVVDLIPLLSKKPPRLAYFNCCFGDTGGLLGVGKQLSRFVPAVLTNRTAAIIDTAQAQALSFWQAILLEGIAPHEALAKQREQLTESNLSIRDIRWITPVLHRHYEQWKAPLPRELSGWQGRDPHWNLRLDRINQFGRVYLDTQEMLSNARPKALAYLWYGLHNQGVDVFHKRLTIDLQQKLANTELIEITPAWSPIDHDYENMLAQAFKINNLDYLEAKIRELTRGSPKPTTLIYIRHEPITYNFTKETTFRPKYLTAYLQWWNGRFVKQLPKSCYALLGISYQVEKPARFYDEMLLQKGLDDVELSDSVFHILDELEKISKKDLLEFIKKHNILLPANTKANVITTILDSTQGDYDKILAELRDIERKGWQQLNAQIDNDDE